MSPAPADASAPPPALVTISVSHFCEKARWAFQRYGLAYVEEGHAPGFHRPSATRAGGCGKTPLLRLPSGGYSDGSDAILRWVDSQAAEQYTNKQQQENEQKQNAGPRTAGGDPAAPPQQPPKLYPADQEDEVARLCKLFDDVLGPASRRWAYSHLLYLPQLGQAILAPPVPWGERLVMRLGGWLLLRPLMAKGLGISPEGGAKALLKIKKVFDEVGSLLADGRPFLAGSQFTAADLTFAALAAPALGQPYGVTPGLEDWTPLAMREEAERLRATPAGRFALRMWEQERGTVVVAEGHAKL